MENDEGIKRNNESKQSGEGDTECRDTDDTCATKESEKEQQAAGWTTRKKLVGASLCFVLFTAFASMSIISPFFPNEALEKGASHTVIGLIFSVYPLVGIVMSPIYGKLMPTYGAKFILLTGLIVEGGTQILFGFVAMMPDGTVFITFCFLLRIIDALGSSGCETAVFVILAQEFPDNMASFTAGGFKLPFIVMGVLLMATVLVLVFTLPSVDEDEVHEEQSFLQTLKIPAVILMGISSIIGGINLTFLDPILSPYLSHFGSHGLSVAQIGFIFLIPSGLYAVISPGIGWIGDKTKKYNLMMLLGFFLACISFMLIGPIPILDFVLPERAVWLACVSMVILGISDSLLLVPLMPEMLQIAKRNGMPEDVSTTGIMSGIYTSTMNIGAFVGPMMAGAMTEHLGFSWATGILAFILLFQGMVMVIFNIYNKAKKRPALELPLDATSSDEREPLLPQSREHTIQV
ncbi:MFS-type transporter SLC18B1-like isoform X2 [Oculina patagonica]